MKNMQRLWESTDATGPCWGGTEPMGVGDEGRIRKRWKDTDYFREHIISSYSVIIRKRWENLTKGHAHDALCQFNACCFIIMCNKPPVGC